MKSLLSKIGLAVPIALCGFLLYEVLTSYEGMLIKIVTICIIIVFIIITIVFAQNLKGK